MHPLGGHGPPMWALFGENVCENKRIESHRGGVRWACPPRSANDNGPKLTDEERDICDRHLTLDELSNALKRMRSGHSPGCDGLGPECYLVFWDQLGPLSLNALNYAIEKGELHLSARRDIITLIPKGKKDPLYLKNWHPLTMLNTVYKILAKSIALRMKADMDKIIHPSQTGFMAGRHIAHNIRKVMDIINITAEENIDAVIESLDF